MLSYFLIDLWFLTPVINAQVLNPTAKLAKSTGTPINETNAEIETHSLTEKQKRESAQSNSNPYTLLYAFHSSNHYVLFLLKNNFLFCLPF